jgi:hypothetical protein
MDIKVTAPSENVSINDIKKKTGTERRKQFNSFAHKSGNDFSSKRIQSNKFYDMNTIKKKKLGSFKPSKSGANYSIGTLKRGDIYGGGSKGLGTQSGIRRSFMGNALGLGNKEKKKQEQNDNDSFESDYSDDDNKDREYMMRNKDLYKTLRKIGV